MIQNPYSVAFKIIVNNFAFKEKKNHLPYEVDQCSVIFNFKSKELVGNNIW